jgi:hypothetical protein
MPTLTTRVDERLVLTLSIDERPAGLLVAYEYQGGMVLEHVVLFPGAPVSALRPLLEAGLEDANTREAKHVRIFQANDLDPRLRKLAASYGFTPYETAEDGEYLVKYAEVGA